MKTRAALAGLLLLTGCLREHPVFGTDNMIPVAELLEGKLSVLPDSIRVLLQNEDKVLLDWSGRKEATASLPVVFQSDGRKFELRIQGFHPVTGFQCAEILLYENREETPLSQCPPAGSKYQPPPKLTLTLSDTALMAGDTLRWNMQVTVPDGNLSLWKLLLRRGAGAESQHASGSLSGRDTALSGTVIADSDGDLRLEWQAYADTARADLVRTVSVADGPLKAHAGADTSVAIGKDFTLSGRASGGVKPYAQAAWIVFGSDTTFSYDLTVPAPAAPDTVDFVFRVRDAAGKVTLDTVRVSSHWASGIAYARISPQAAGGVEPSVAAWSSSSARPAALRLEKGRLRIVFPGLAKAGRSRADVQVTGFGVELARCRTLSAGASANDLAVETRCDDAFGQPQDVPLSISVQPPLPAGVGTLAYATMDRDTFPDGYRPADSLTENPGPVEAWNSAGGHYSVDFRNARGLIGDPYSPMVTAFGGTGAWCNMFSSSAFDTNIKAMVDCYATEGSKSAKSTFSVSLMGPLTGPTDIDLAYAAFPEAADRTYNSRGGAVTVIKTGTGRYQADFKGLAGPTAARPVAVHAVVNEALNSSCQASSVEGTDDLRVHVRCFNFGGALADAKFLLRVLR